MTKFYLVRHGDPDPTMAGKMIFKGRGRNFAALSEEGQKQIKNAATDPRLKDCEIILASPYTRALQSAAIISKEYNEPGNSDRPRT